MQEFVHRRRVPAARTKHWRVFYTSPRTEKKCEERLLASRLDVFLPKRIVVRQWKDRRMKVEEPLFQSYIFAHVDERERIRVLQVPGIVRCLAFGGALAALSDAEVEQLKIAQNDPERLVATGASLPVPGTPVTVEVGPLRGLRGEVVEHRGQTHVVIHIAALRQAVRVRIAAAWLRTADRPYYAV